jgi:hypothetical protein
LFELKVLGHDIFHILARAKTDCAPGRNTHEQNNQHDCYRL